MESFIENFGSWQSNACTGAVSLVPAAAASYESTGMSFAGAGRVDAHVAVLGQPKAATSTLTHKSITRPGSPPRGRLR